MTAPRRWLSIAVAWLLRTVAALLDAIDPPDGSHAATDAVSSPPPDDAVTLPQPPAAPPGLGQHPYEGWPLYGIPATAERDGLMLAVDGSGPCAVITEPSVSLRATGWQPALAVDAGIQWATDRATLVRLRNALAAA